MEAGHVTPQNPRDQRIAALEAQHIHDLDALDAAADVITGQDRVIAIRNKRIASLERDLPRTLMTTEERHDAKRRLHEAIQGYLDDNELAIHWVLTVDVTGPDDMRYLAHRAGGGVDGSDNPTAWTALGMLRASVGVAERQLAEMTSDNDEDEDS